MRDYIDIVFVGAPNPKGSEFVEVEDDHGKSISAGVWSKRSDGLWQLRITDDVFHNKPSQSEGAADE